MTYFMGVSRAKPFLTIICLLLFIAVSITAQDELTTTIFERTILRDGPGSTYSEVGSLGAGVEVMVLERNYIGDWLYIRRAALPGTEDLYGWVRTGFVTIPDDIRFSQFPVNDDLPDAKTETIPDPDIVRLYDAPIVPEISDAMMDVFEQGQQMGNYADVITKIGDSNSASAVYLPSPDELEYDLGPYDFLHDAVDYFGASFHQGSISARVGMNAVSVFDSIWSNKEKCQENEAPILCEYRVTKPSVALIMFGPNDLKALNTDQFRAQMTLIVEESLDRGIVPVLSTFSSNPELDTWFQAVRFNLILLDVAREYEVPIINLWAAVRGLPAYGLGDDDTHLTAAGASVSFNGQESRFGIALQNLLVLHTLNRIMEKLELTEGD